MAVFFLRVALILWGSVSLSASSGLLPISSFDEAYTHLFGDGNLMVLDTGNSVRLSLDERTGSGFVSHDPYLYGFFSASIKLPADHTAGLVIAFYLSNADMFKKNHDELDFEFLGNTRGNSWRLQTNVYGNGSTHAGREERYLLWFDPSEDFHEYSILWMENQITFSIDSVPIREIKKSEAMDGSFFFFFPSKPMSVYATIWDGSSWATAGGKYKVNYKHAPFIAEYSNFVLRGCAVDPMNYESECSSSANPTAENLKKVMTPAERQKMLSFRRKYMTYSYCYDRNRYPLPLQDCLLDSKEAQHLKRFDPVTFSGRRHHQNRQHPTNSNGGLKRDI